MMSSQKPVFKTLKVLTFLATISAVLLSAAMRPEPGYGYIPAKDVTAYGAKGNGRNMDTRAIQQAIDACAEEGGGTVYFPNGTYLSGTIVLASNVTLYLDAGATLLGSRNLEDYDPPYLIYAHEAKNISIQGKGVIDGQGASFWDEDFNPLERPARMIELVACQNVTIRDVTIQNSPSWAVELLGCDRVVVDAVSIINPRRGPNTDGLDIVSSSNVLVSNCYIEGGDDSICLKARLKDKPCENVTVTNCVLISDDTAIKLGTRSTGDIRHCVFSNIAIRNTRYGISLFMKDGGTYEDIQFSNITMEMETGTARYAYPIMMDIEPRTDTSKVCWSH